MKNKSMIILGDSPQYEEKAVGLRLHDLTQHFLSELYRAVLKPY